MDITNVWFVCTHWNKCHIPRIPKDIFGWQKFLPSFTITKAGNIWNFFKRIILKPLPCIDKYLTRHNKFGKPNSNDDHAYSYWNSTHIWPVETNFEIVRLYSKICQDRHTFRLWGKTLWISRIDGLIWSLLSLKNHTYELTILFVLWNYRTFILQSLN